MSNNITRTPNRRMTRTVAWLICLLFILIAVLTAISFTTRALAPESQDKDAPTVLVVIPHGTDAHDIGRILYHRHLIRSTVGFLLAARMAGLTDNMRAGRYELSPAMPPSQMAQLIALGRTAEDLVTIPEGFTDREIAQRLAGQGMVNAQDFLTLAQTQGKTFHINGWTPPNNSLEGYLFPDTYRIAKGATARDILVQMLTDFQQRVLQPDGPEFAQYPGGLAAAITMASLVEREAKTPGDRPLIAAALDNRLRIGMRLQCDATVQYALPVHKTRLLYADLGVKSPYNTYLHVGLPPTPIANPGLPSIEAALHPAHVDYLYYVARPDGSHIFSATLAGHDKAIAEIHAGADGT